MKSFNKKQKGFTLLEMMIVLIAAAFILAWAGTKGKDMWENYNVTRLTDGITSISQAMNEKYGNQASYAGASMTEISKIVAENIGDGVGTNPFKGNYSVAPGTEPRTYKVTATKVPEREGLKASFKWTDVIYTPGTETLVVTFGK